MIVVSFDYQSMVFSKLTWDEIGVISINPQSDLLVIKKKRSFVCMVVYVSICVDVSHQTTWCSIVMFWFPEGGLIHVENHFFAMNAWL